MSDQPTAAVLPGPSGALECTDIQRILPHRFPMLLIDRITEMQREKRVVAIKNVTANEPFFAGHFPGAPIMPGVLVVEAMAQAGAVLLMSEFPDPENRIILFTGIERAKFRRPVVPGDQLRLEVNVLAWRTIAGRMEGHAYVGDKLMAEAVLTCRVVPRKAPGASAPPA